LAAALLRAQEASRKSNHLVRRLEACGTIPDGSDLQRLLADAQNRCSEVAFAAEEVEQLLASAPRRARLSEEELLKKCIGLAERAEAAAVETETSVSFAAQLGGLDLPSLSDVPAAIDLETTELVPDDRETDEIPQTPVPQQKKAKPAAKKELAKEDTEDWKDDWGF